ncbi:tetratricopeptide repeat protein [Clostridium sp.]|uniref:tetratricopeptide repeat protein n=1 Tax=Clostridium sp. TaxID=1506 RepID=UPI003D6C8280
MNQLLNEHVGKIVVSRGKNPKQLYAHQLEALNKLNKLSGENRYKGMLVFPTGGGKTFTAVSWVLRNAIDKNRKVLWIAHRHELLNQAKYTIENSAYSDILPNKKEFNYRVISGMHDRPVNIKTDDDFIIASKDSLNYGIEYLKKWISKNKNNIVLIIDEAHHAPAKSYRNIINLLDTENNEWFQMLGLTATPFRTAESEQGILGNIFTNGIAYGIDLKTLISRKILADPIFEELNTKMDIASELTDRDVKSIQAFDSIPESIAIKIAKNKERNKMIVNHYIENREKYDQMLLFAIDIDHAITLNALFNQSGVPTEFIVSSIRDMYTKVTISNKENEDKIRRFKDGTVNILINVNILTEGIDLPKVQSVFLTRPTISTILMTQMVGRALRGVAAGGTEKAYIVSFIDNWNDKIAWVNPETLIASGSGAIPEIKNEKKEYITRLVAISLMEEFAKIMDRTIDTSELESVDFIERIPVGMYSFSILISSGDSEEYTKNCGIIVYDSFKQAYEDFINDLDLIFKEKNLSEKEFLDDYELDYLCTFVKKEYFEGYYNPINYKNEDIKDVLRYYALNETKPIFLDFDDRNNFDLSETAKYIWNNDLSIKKQKEYLDLLWQDEQSFLKVFFGHNKKFFLNQIDIELHKVSNPEEYKNVIDVKPKNIPENIDITKLAIYEIKEKDINYWRSLVNAVYNNAKDSEGYYHCAISDFKSKNKVNFQIDHIHPMSRGGLSIPSNLQLLAIWINIDKGNKIDYKIQKDNKDEDNSIILNIHGENANENDKSIKSFEGLDSKSADEILTIINDIGEAENYDELIKLCNKAINLYPNRYEFYNKKAESLCNMGNNDEALKCIDSSLQIDAGQADNYVLKGRINFEMNNLEEALVNTRKAIAIEPENLRALNNIGNVLIDQKNYKEALKYFDIVIEKDAKNDRAYYSKGIVFENINSYDEAIRCYDKAINIKRDEKKYYLRKGNVLDCLEKQDKAIKIYNKIIKMDETYVEAYLEKGKIYQQQGKYETALKCYNKIIQLQPSSEIGYLQKGDLLNDKKLFNKATECFNRVLELNPENGEAYHKRGISFEMLKQYEDALSDFERAVQFNEELENVYFRMAYIYDKKRKYELALKFYDKVLEINDEEIGAYNNKGYALEKMKRFDEALEYYNKALEIDSDYKLTIRNKKNLLVKMENN